LNWQQEINNKTKTKSLLVWLTKPAKEKEHAFTCMQARKSHQMIKLNKNDTTLEYILLSFFMDKSLRLLNQTLQEHPSASWPQQHQEKWFGWWVQWGSHSWTKQSRESGGQGWHCWSSQKLKPESHQSWFGNATSPEGTP